MSSMAISVGFWRGTSSLHGEKKGRTSPPSTMNERQRMRCRNCWRCGAAVAFVVASASYVAGRTAALWRGDSSACSWPATPQTEDDVVLAEPEVASEYPYILAPVRLAVAREKTTTRWPSQKLRQLLAPVRLAVTREKTTSRWPSQHLRQLLAPVRLAVARKKTTSRWPSQQLRQLKSLRRREG